MQKNNLDETTNLLLNNEYSLNDNDEVDEEIEYKNIKKKKKTKKKKIKPPFSPDVRSCMHLREMRGGF